MIKGITRINEHTDPELLKDGEVTELNNLVLEGGKAKKRGGFVKFNSNTAGASQLLSLHNVVDESENNLVFAMCGDGSGSDGILKKCSDGTGSWSSLKTGLDASSKTRLASYNGKFIVTNGVDVPFITDGTTVWNLDIDAPDVQGVTMALGAGGSLDVTSLYRYIMVYTTDDGQQGQVSKPFTHIEGATDIDTTDGSNLTVDFTDLPVSSDTRVTGRKLYRTEGDGEVYYLLASLDNSTTTYSDSKADADLYASESIEFFQDIEYAKYDIIHKDRLWLGNVSTGLGKSVNTPAHFPLTASDANNGATGMDDGTYRYKVSFVDNQGRESELSTYVEETVDHTIGGYSDGEGKVTLTTIPRPRIGAGELDQTISEIRIYRTKQSGTTYYYVDSLATLTTTTYNDTAKDSALTEAYPKNTNGTSTADKKHKCGVLYSNLGDPSEFPVLNYKDIYPDDGDEITGLVDQPDGVLVFKTNSICKVYTQGSHENWRVVKVNENMGCDEPDSIAEIDNVVYMVNNNRVYRTNGVQTQYVSQEKQTTLDTVTTFYDATFLVNKRWYVLSTDIGVFVFDEIEQCWYEFTTADSLDFKCIMETKNGTNSGKLIVGEYDDGLLLDYDESSKYDYDSVSGEDGDEIVPSLKSKHFISDTFKGFRFQKFYANYKKRDDQSVNHKIINPENNEEKAVTDSTNSTVVSDNKDFYKKTDEMTGDLVRATKWRYEVSGAGLDEFNSMKVKARETSERRV